MYRLPPGAALSPGRPRRLWLTRPRLAGARAADAGIVGKTNPHELAMLPLGTNPWFGTPVNPLDPSLIAGGSSSGSAVAVANPAGRYRAGLRHRRANPSALGVLRNRRGEDDTRPGERAGRAAAGPSLDTMGPMASSVAGVAAVWLCWNLAFVPIRLAHE